MIEARVYDVFSEDKTTLDGIREGSYLGQIYREGEIFVFTSEIDELTSLELRNIADHLDKLNEKK